MRQICFFFIFVGFNMSWASAQQDSGDVALPDYQRVEVGYIFGGQMYNQNFSYNPGIDVQGVYGLQLSKRVGVGLGVGYYALEHERFLPIFAEVRGRTRKSNHSPVLSMQMGYAHAWFEGNDDIAGFDFSGGVYFSAALGMQFQVSQQTHVLFNVAYRHQFAQIAFPTFANSNYAEMANYDMVVLSLGVVRSAK